MHWTPNYTWNGTKVNYSKNEKNIKSSSSCKLWSQESNLNDPIITQFQGQVVSTRAIAGEHH